MCIFWRVASCCKKVMVKAEHVLCRGRPGQQDKHHCGVGSAFLSLRAGEVPALPKKLPKGPKGLAVRLIKAEHA